MLEKDKCFVCGGAASVQLSNDPIKYFYSCPIWAVVLVLAFFY